MRRNAPRRGEPRSVLMAAKLLAAATTDVRRTASATERLARFTGTRRIPIGKTTHSAARRMVPTGRSRPPR